MQEKESIVFVHCELKILSPGPLKIFTCIVVYSCKTVHILYKRTFVSLRSVVVVILFKHVCYMVLLYIHLLLIKYFQNECKTAHSIHQ